MSIILEFKNEFRGCKVFKLEQNYRSTKNILAAAYEVVKKNTKRNEITIWTDNEQGETIEVFEGSDSNDEARLVADSIEKKVEEGEFSYSDIAILYRTNSLSRNFENY
ncbi:MAG: ATP-dependent DNA helicase PcrA, partial [Armatimonadetes bacterium]|nr:ATP-dependent DNA helicase PcrA [Candidatus Hippobium faecium]